MMKERGGSVLRRRSAQQILLIFLRRKFPRLTNHWLLQDVFHVINFPVSISANIDPNPVRVVYL